MRKQTRKKKGGTLVCVLLALALLSACGKENTTRSESSGAKETLAADAAVSIWKADFVALASEKLRAKLTDGIACGEELYAISSGVIADETPEDVTPEWPEQYQIYGPILVKTDLAGESEILLYTPERPETESGESGGVLFERLCAASDGSLWLLENRYRIREESGESWEERTLVRLGTDGTVQRRFPFPEEAVPQAEARESGASAAVSGMAEDAKGNLCLAIHLWSAGDRGYTQQNHVLVLDSETGAVRHTIEFAGEIAELARLGSGQIAAAYYRGASPVIVVLNTEKGTTREVTALDDFVSDVTGGPGETLYYSAGNGFWRLDTETAKAEKLFDWAACDVSCREEDSVCVLADGRVVRISGRESTDGVRSELALLSPTTAEALAERKTLRLALVNLNPYTSEMISRFNRSQTEYRIEVTDYAQYNDYTSANPEDWYAGMTRLQTELIAGKVPDILDISLLPVSRLGEKGILEDLLPYLDADPELGRDDLNMHVVEAFAENGKLYQTVSNYYVMTTLGLSDAVGERIGWSMSDFTAAMQRLQAAEPESTVFDVYTTRDDALTFLLYLQMEDYVDWSTGECFFDTEPFRELLRFVRGFPTAYDWSRDVSQWELDSDLRLLSGQQLMKTCNLTCFEDVQANTAGLGGAAVSFVGYPTANGVGSMFAQFGNAFAISSACADKEAAWAFVRQFFLPDYQQQLSSSVFPTNRTVYEDRKREAQSTSYKRNPDGSFALDAEGKRIEDDHGSVYVGGTEVKLRAVTEEEIALVEEITAATTHVLSTDSSLKDILSGCAAAYFAGQQSVEETARQIQSRAMLYVNEQR